MRVKRGHSDEQTICFALKSTRNSRAAGAPPPHEANRTAVIVAPLLAHVAASVREIPARAAAAAVSATQKVGARTIRAKWKARSVTWKANACAWMLFAPADRNKNHMKNPLALATGERACRVEFWHHARAYAVRQNSTDGSLKQ
jgi:hypothetical protein